ncbi:alcohol dehydrogenase [Acetobacter tropicalis NBRC 101654]|uniref:Alcohol dehydrogenase n=1 Tax=Acetobacter tropicalis NBRC 101654 TaxID=749388 RepID=F7VH21_9PROT|nr:NAD(P)-dependent alcohol dehydrogenase [Acetobacter tropicalis]GAA09666.1 alcohol dehydrogenase [Acetobacter tropicalis NBRC 101654]
MRLYRLKHTENGVRPVLDEAPDSSPVPGEVLVKIQDTSVNYRDLLLLGDPAMTEGAGRVPLSDAAGSVAAVGKGVADWKEGDPVCIPFFRDWIGGIFRNDYMRSAFGGPNTEGVLQDYVSVPARSLIAKPEYLSFAEAATLPCAAVTAWQALMVRGHLREGDTVLVQGTGGVALFALQLAVARGAQVIIISSSDEKLSRARKLGASELINYGSTPDWDEAVNTLTHGDGVSHVLELGGPETYPRSINSIGAGGHIAQIGMLTGFGPRPDIDRIRSTNASIDGITVGSGDHFREMNAFLTHQEIHPVIDRVFPFEQAGEAYDYLQSAEHFGKIVIDLAS